VLQRKSCPKWKVARSPGTYHVIDYIWDGAAIIGARNHHILPGHVNVWNSLLNDIGPEVTAFLIVRLYIFGDAFKVQLHVPDRFVIDVGWNVDRGDRCSRWKGWRFEADAEAKKEAENVTHVEISCVGCVGGKVEKKLRLEAFTSCNFVSKLGATTLKNKNPLGRLHIGHWVIGWKRRL